MLQSFCGCFKLKVGCILFCFVFMVFQLKDLNDCFQVFKYLGPEKNEDEENKKQKLDAKSHYTVKAMIAGFLSAAGLINTGCRLHETNYNIEDWLFNCVLQCLYTVSP
ncbi:uncharacterized protein LOC124365211 [Homalodisca vitripennis]|uniref:uncharacterized protein LOC124365211 n=1 Tax=Homalodisca vitripennis TaxID=197043 RepID=UPI001EEA6CD4|nr:uncharacterized protein LOC124365211 [Homalodisca vitripennis]